MFEFSGLELAKFEALRVEAELDMMSDWKKIERIVSGDAVLVMADNFLEAECCGMAVDE